MSLADLVPIATGMRARLYRLDDPTLSPSERYRLNNIEKCRAAVRASKLKAKRRGQVRRSKERKEPGQGR